MKQWIQTIIGVLAIVGLGFLSGVGQSLWRDKPVILGSSTPSTATSEHAKVPEISPSIEPATNDPEFNARLDAPVPDGMLTLRQAHQRWINGSYFIDARHKKEYDQGHVSGAAHLNAETFFTDEGEAEMRTIPPDAPVVVYCVGGLCDASENTVALLAQFGYTDLSIMGVGFDDWEAAGLPIDSSAGSEDIESEGSP